jgi:alkylation response protein AidB-like acyl-CoA dehydrogenase
MWHDVGIPVETSKLRLEVRQAVEERVAPYAREIGHREESVETFPSEAFRGLADAGVFALPFTAGSKSCTAMRRFSKSLKAPTRCCCG